MNPIQQFCLFVYMVVALIIAFVMTWLMEERNDEDKDRSEETKRKVSTYGPILALLFGMLWPIWLSLLLLGSALDRWLDERGR